MRRLLIIGVTAFVFASGISCGGGQSGEQPASDPYVAWLKEEEARFDRETEAMFACWRERTASVRRYGDCLRELEGWSRSRELRCRLESQLYLGPCI